jgi:hypothetical protein
MVWLMSDSSAAAPVPPGWYADTTVPGQMRWWSGVEWTEHVSAPYAAARPARPALPPDRPVYNVFIWLIVLLPLVSAGLLFAWQPTFTFPSIDSSDGAAGVFSMYSSIFTVGYVLIAVGGLVIYGLSALFAYRDSVWLRKQGVERPFAWPWVFLYSPVYVIGRSVIVRRVAAPRGLVPIWVFIGVYVVSFLVSMVWTLVFMANLYSQLPSYGSYPA